MTDAHFSIWRQSGNNWTWLLGERTLLHLKSQYPELTKVQCGIIFTGLWVSSLFFTVQQSIFFCYIWIWLWPSIQETTQKVTLVVYDTHMPKNEPLPISILVIQILLVPSKHSSLWHCCFGSRKSIWPIPVYTEWWGVGMVICLEWGANNLHVATNATAIPSSFASEKSRIVYPSGMQLPRMYWKKGH